MANTIEEIASHTEKYGIESKESKKEEQSSLEESEI